MAPEIKLKMYFRKPELETYLDADYGIFRFTKLDNAKTIGLQIEENLRPSKETIKIISFEGDGSAEEYCDSLAKCITYDSAKPCKAVLNGNGIIRSSDIVCVDKHFQCEDTILGCGNVRIVFEITPRSEIRQKEIEATEHTLTIKIWGNPKTLCDTAQRIKETQKPFTNEWMAMLMLSIAPIENNIRIESLGLPNGVRNCLRRANIQTIAELTGCTATELQSVRTLGVQSLTKITKALAKQGYSLEER